MFRKALARHDDDFVLLGIDYKDITSDARAFAKEKRATWPILKDPDNAVALGIRGAGGAADVLHRARRHDLAALLRAGARRPLRAGAGQDRQAARGIRHHYSSQVNRLKAADLR